MLNALLLGATMSEPADKTPQRNLEELLPLVHQKPWIEVLNRLRRAHQAGDGVQKEKEFQFGFGYITALRDAGLVTDADKPDLVEMLLFPELRR
jgi:hypothetical protein